MKRCSFVTALFVFFPAIGIASVLKVDEFRLDLYMSFEYEYQIESQGNGDANGSLDLDQLDLMVNYQRDDFRLAADIVIEHGFSTEDERGNIELSFGFVEYAASDKLRFRAGKFLTPFGIHNEFNTVRSSFLTVKEPWSTNKPGKLTENGYRFFPRRQAGVGAVGGIDTGIGFLEYDLIISNGEQEETNPFEEDNNSQKAVTARFNFEPKSVPNLILGLSAYRDTLSQGNERATLESLGIHADFGGGRWLVRAEIVTGDVTTPGQKRIEQVGGYIDLGYQLQRATPYLQFQHVENSLHSADAVSAVKENAQAVIAGLLVKLKETAVLKVENAHYEGSSQNGAFLNIPGRAYNEIRAGFVIGF